LGQALALRFYQAGYSLALVARRTQTIQSWVDAHQISAERYFIYSADVSVADSIVSAGYACLAQQGLPDVVIACAVMSVGVDAVQHAAHQCQHLRHDFFNAAR